MKLLRLILIGVGVLVFVAVVAVAVAFNSSFQTWATRRALAGQPALHATVGSVDAGLKHVAVKDVHFSQSGAVLTLPALEADLPLIAAGMNKKILVSRLVAKGWTLDLSQQPPSAPANPAAGAIAAPAAAARAFGGIFGQFQLPVDLSLDGVDLEGDVILPAGQGRAKVHLTGGGLGAGRDGKFDLTGEAALAQKDVNVLTLRGTLTTTMDTPRTFTRLGAKLDAAASGAQFPQGVKLAVDIAAARTAAGETYSSAVTSGDRELVSVHSDFPANAKKIDGTWKLDVRDADVAPFALGFPLPAFTAAGEGKFDTDAGFTAIHASGKLDATADRLGVVAPPLAAIGAVKLTADFDVAQRDNAVSVERLSATVAGAQPIVAVQALQPFTFDLSTRALQAGDPAHELLGITLQGLPLAWARSFLPGLSVTGGDVRGELVATTRSGGVMVRSKSPVTIAGLSIAQEGKPLLQGVDLSLDTTADYAPQGWQAEVMKLTLRTGAATLVTLEAKAGQLAGKDQPIKATGKLAANLSALLAQPAAKGALALTAGDASVDFAASLGATKEIQAKVELRDLAADPKVTKEKLPAISTQLRADVAAGGLITLHAPILLEREGRKSDLAFAGTFKPEKGKLALDAQVTSTNLVVDDAKVLSALLPAGAPPPATATATADKKAPKDTAPPWAGVTGTVELALAKVIYSDSFQASDVKGKLRIDAGSVKLDGVQASLGSEGSAKVNGTVTFDAAAPQPYAVAADVAVTEFDPGPLLKAVNPGQPPTVEGKFSVTSKVTGRAKTLAELVEGVGGDIQLTSKGGTFRALSTVLPIKAPSQSALGMISGILSSAVDRNSTSGAVTSALLEITKALSEIQYDQVTVTVNRDPQQSIQLKTFNLISPDARIGGVGQITYTPGVPLMKQAIDVQLTIAARGRLGELMGQARLLKPEKDSLGYTSFSFPVKIGGTLAKTDTSDFARQLLTVALEKSGVMDKATDFLKGIIPGGK